LLLLY